jgi:protein required for attachment to host cells
MKKGSPNRNPQHSPNDGSERAETWILVADAKRARLLRGALTPQARVHLEEAATLETSWIEHDRGRPAILAGGKGPRPVASIGHEDEEGLRHFARELAAWLERQLAAHHVEDCVVFAPARFLGALRKQVPPRLHASLSEHAGELTHLTPGELARHPAVAGRLGT